MVIYGHLGTSSISLSNKMGEWGTKYQVPCLEEEGNRQLSGALTTNKVDSNPRPVGAKLYSGARPGALASEHLGLGASSAVSLGIAPSLTSSSWQMYLPCSILNILENEGKEALCRQKCFA